MSDTPAPPKTIKLNFLSQVTAGALGISLMLHLLVLLLVGSYVIFEGVIPKKTFIEVAGISDSEVMDNIPEPETAEETPVVTDTTLTQETTTASSQSTSSDILISTGVNTNFSLVSSNVVTPTTRLGTGFGSKGKEGSGTGGISGKAVRSLFGSSESTPSTLKGTLFDLKIDKEGKPITHNYNEVVAKFGKYQNKDVFDKFYEVKRPLYATHIYMPTMSADQAPQAFEVANEVRPSEWVVYYEGVFTAPKSGTYRFATYADDVIIVVVDGRVVSDGSRISLGITPGTSFSGIDPNEDTKKKHSVANGFLSYGKWFTMSEGRPTPIQVLIGENPGGQFCAYMFVQEQDKTYPMVQAGNTSRPLLPLFRMQNIKVQRPDGASDMSAPPFAADGPVFQNK